MKLPATLGITASDTQEDPILSNLVLGRNELVCLGLWLMLERSKVCPVSIYPSHCYIDFVGESLKKRLFIPSSDCHNSECLKRCALSEYSQKVCLKCYIPAKCHVGQKWQNWLYISTFCLIWPHDFLSFRSSFWPDNLWHMVQNIFLSRFMQRAKLF